MFVRNKMCMYIQLAKGGNHSAEFGVKLHIIYFEFISIPLGMNSPLGSLPQNITRALLTFSLTMKQYGG